MVIIPAIDMLNGECVRLFRGDYDEVTVYGKDPVAVARSFEEAGAKRIHLVDLDAARGEGHANRKKIRRIRKAVSCVLEVGGGIRSEDDVEELLDLGVDRIVVGTVMAYRPDLVAGWIQHFGSVIIAGIDALDGQVRVSGWEDGAGITDVELARKAKEIGACSIIYTDISRDGTLEGPDLERTNLIAREAGIPLILSGGISSPEDLSSVQEKGDTNLVGVITGKALYEGKIQLKEAIESFQQEDTGDMEW